jgi:hypothetical protein
MDKRRNTAITLLASTGISSLLASAYKGYCDSHNIPLSPEINAAILGGPTTFGALSLATMAGITIGNDYREQFIKDRPQFFEKLRSVAREDGQDPELAAKRVAGMATLEDGVGGACGGLMVGGAMGVITTTLGYEAGYLIGNFTK